MTMFLGSKTYVYPADENVFFSFSFAAGFWTREGTTALLTVVVVLSVLPCVVVIGFTTVVAIVGGFCTTGAVGRIPVAATVDFTVYAVVGLRTTVVTGRTWNKVILIINCIYKKFQKCTTSNILKLVIITINLFNFLYNYIDIKFIN